nr:protein involved in de novo 2 [Quercus suber]
MAGATADVLILRMKKKHEEPQEKKQKMTDEEKQEEEDVPHREKVGLALDDELQEKKQKKTDEEKQEEKEDVPYHEKDGLPLDDKLLSDDDDCFPDELPEMTRAEYIINRLIRAGFDVDDFSHSFACGRIEMMGFGGSLMMLIRKNLKKNFKFKEVVKANVQCVAGLMYHITFKAEDASIATIETFQAKVWRGIGFVEVTSIRVKPISISKQDMDPHRVGPSIQDVLTRQDVHRSNLLWDAPLAGEEVPGVLTCRHQNKGLLEGLFEGGWKGAKITTEHPMHVLRAYHLSLTSLWPNQVESQLRIMEKCKPGFEIHNDYINALRVVEELGRLTLDDERTAGNTSEPAVGCGRQAGRRQRQGGLQSSQCPTYGRRHTPVPTSGRRKTPVPTSDWRHTPVHDHTMEEASQIADEMCLDTGYDMGSTAHDDAGPSHTFAHGDTSRSPSMRSDDTCPPISPTTSLLPTTRMSPPLTTGTAPVNVHGRDEMRFMPTPGRPTPGAIPPEFVHTEFIQTQIPAPPPEASHIQDWSRRPQRTRTHPPDCGTGHGKVRPVKEPNAIRNSSLQLASLEQDKADVNVLKLAEDQKRQKEELHKRIIQLEKQLDAKQALELEIERLRGSLNVMKHMGDDGDVEILEKVITILKQLQEKEGELEDLEALNQTLIVKERKSNDELQEARKELVNVSVLPLQ